MARARALPPNGTLELRFALEPEHLGPVRIRIESHGEMLRIRIVASSGASCSNASRRGIPAPIVLLIILGAIVLVLAITLARRYKRCPSNRVLVKYGWTKGKSAAQCIHGGATFIWPLIQSCDYLSLEPFVVPIDLTNALSQENIRVTVPTSVTAAARTPGSGSSSRTNGSSVVGFSPATMQPAASPKTTIATERAQKLENIGNSLFIAPPRR